MTMKAPRALTGVFSLSFPVAPPVSFGRSLGRLLGRLLSWGVAGGAAWLAPSHAQAATTMVVQRGQEAPATLYADGDRLRMDMPPRQEAAPGPGDPQGKGPARGHGHDNARPSAIIIDAAAKKIDLIQDADKTYVEMTEEDVKRMQAKFAAMRAQMAEKLKNLPPEKRQQMEAMMAMGQAKGASKFEFQSLGQKKTINGMACEMYKVSRNGVAHEEDCISPWSAGLVKQSDFAGLSKFSHQMLSDLGPQAGGIPLFDQYPGLPISRVPLDPKGGRGLESQVKSVKNGAVSAALFTVPAGYTKKALPTGEGAAPGGAPGMGAEPRPGSGMHHEAGTPPPAKP